MARAQIKPKLAILALDPSNGGGVLHSLLAAHKILSEHFEVTVFHASFDPEISTSVKRLRFSARIVHYQKFGMNLVAIGVRWAFFEPGHQTWNLDLWEKALDGYENFFVTSGTAIAGHPLALLDKKYCLWVATTLDSERRFAQYPNVFRKALAWATRPQMKEIEKEVLQKANSVLAMSGQTAGEIEQICPTVRCRVVGFPIDVDQSPSETRTAPSGKPFDAIAIARWADPRKDLRFLIQAWTLVVAKHPNAKLALVGSRPEPKKSKLVDELVHDGGITCFWDTSPEKKMELLQQSKILLISSFQEGLGITGLEAGYWAKIPVVSTNCGGPADYVIDSQTGFLIKTPEEMAAKILTLLNNQELTTSLGKNLFDLVKERFGRDVIEREFLRALG